MPNTFFLFVASTDRKNDFSSLENMYNVFDLMIEGGPPRGYFDDCIQSLKLVRARDGSQYDLVMLLGGSERLSRTRSYFRKEIFPAVTACLDFMPIERLHLYLQAIDDEDAEDVFRDIKADDPFRYDGFNIRKSKASDMIYWLEGC